jgi:hypothetical protein
MKMKKHVITKIGVDIMGFFSQVHIDILDMHAGGSSILEIVGYTGLPIEQVKEVIDMEADFNDMDVEDPTAYAEHAADLDAEYFGAN